MFVLPTVELIDSAWDGEPPYNWLDRVFFDPNLPTRLFSKQSWFS